MKTNFFGIEKKESETDWEFCFRCIRAKHSKDIDADWEDLVEFFELPLHRDSLRKAVAVGDFSAIKVAEYYEKKMEDLIIIQNDNNSDYEYLQELEEKKLEIQKERVKLSTLRNSLNKTVRETSRKELFYESVRDEIAKNPLQPYEYNYYTFEENHKEYLLVFADVHYGSTFDVGINKYSPQVCQERFEKLYNETLALIYQEGIHHLHVASEGDLIQGVLRLSDIALNSISIVEQVSEVSRLVANFLNNLSKHCQITYHHVINANHSELRLLNSKSGELNEDVELLIGNYIKDLLMLNDRVEVIIGEDTVSEVNLCGYNIALLHGQYIKNKETFIRDLSATKHKNYEFLIMGHIHHYSCATVSTNKDNTPTQVISVPSIVGSCPYSKKIMKTSPSGALMLVFEETKGKTNTYEITL